MRNLLSCTSFADMRPVASRYLSYSNFEMPSPCCSHFAAVAVVADGAVVLVLATSLPY